MASVHSETKKANIPQRKTNGNLILSEMFAELFPLYLECNHEVKAVIGDMAQIVNDPEATPDERAMAIATIAEALFPRSRDGLGVDLEEYTKEAAGSEADELHRMAEEEATFAERLRSRMEERGITQASLAAEIGVGQSAISMMLTRDCRPQRRTVERIAQALKVSPEDLWPGFNEEG